MISPICLLKSKTQKLCILINFLAIKKYVIKQIPIIINKCLNKRWVTKKSFLNINYNNELINKKTG